MKKRFVAICTSLLISAAAILPGGLPVNATSVASHSISASTIDTMAIHAANTEMGWPSVSIGDTHAIYDFNNSIIAYSVDVHNIDSNKTGYILLSSSPNDEPIMEFSRDKPSPYDSIDSAADTCLFSGMGGYYAKSKADSHYYELENQQTLPQNTVVTLKQTDMQKKYTTANVKGASAERKALALGTQYSLATVTASESVTLPVPFYTQNDYSCCETAAAMALRYDFPSYVPPDKASIVNELKDKMNWVPFNGTDPANVPTGIDAAMIHWGYYAIDSHNTGFGRDSATFDLVRVNLSSGLPLLIIDMEPRGNAKYYQHAMCIVGFQGSQYITVHDTWSTSNVTINYYSETDLGDNFCFTKI